MTDQARLAEICRRAQEICKNHDPSLDCDVFDAGGSEQYALLYPKNPPSEDQVGIMVVGQMHSQFDLPALSGELEQIDGVWKVFLTFVPTHSSS